MHEQQNVIQKYIKKLYISKEREISNVAKQALNFFKCTQLSYIQIMNFHLNVYVLYINKFTIVEGTKTQTQIIIY